MKNERVENECEERDREDCDLEERELEKYLQGGRLTGEEGERW